MNLTLPLVRRDVRFVTSIEVDEGSKPRLADFLGMLSSCLLRHPASEFMS
jgi:hypothetical protein